jgi:phosphoserine phosphatase RsbU/P
MTNSSSLPPVLYVDDEKDNLTVFNSSFRRYYDIHIALSGFEALEIMRKENIWLIITDQRMPGMTGTEFLERTLAEYPDCIRIILTGYSDMNAVIHAINKSMVYRYITKPWELEEMKVTIDNGIEMYKLKEQNKKLFEELKEANQTLEQKVISRTMQIELQNKEITSSIHYARKIQNALLPQKEELDRLLPSHFVFSRPKGIVSGDYYWVSSRDEKIVFTVADCTGHGIPGAFMSILGVAFLNDILNKMGNIRANEILNQLRVMVIRSLHQTGKSDETRDGMEMALCVIDFNRMMLQFSGAFRPLYIFRGNDILELQGDNMPIGIYDDEEVSFTNRESSFEKGDMIYLFTDGYVDQLGGTERKTFRTFNFKKLLAEICILPLHKQCELLEHRFNEWRGEINQVDDILVVGIRL